MSDRPSRWTETEAPRGHTYDERWARLAAEGRDPHGEVAFVQRFEPRRVLDAGCGTGRVAIELVERGVHADGFDLDPSMLAVATEKAPHVRWTLADAVDVDLTADGGYDVVVLAGNVLIFVAPGTEPDVVTNMARHLTPQGRLVAGFELRPDRYDLAALDRDASAAGLVLEERWSTWEADRWTPGGEYAVSVFSRA